MAEIRRIVRVANTDLDGSLSAVRALRKIHGINWTMSRAMCTLSGVEPSQKLGALGDAEIKKLEESIVTQSNSPTLPKWMLNRRKDFETGRDRHIVGPTLDFRHKADINFQKRIHSRKGIRHELGLPVRGQHTKSTGRKQKSVGVSRKRAAPAQKAAPAAAPKPAGGKPAAGKPAAAKPAAAGKPAAPAKK